MLAVNGENVVGLSVAEIRERIVGPIGSEVSIALESGASGQVYERVLVRGNAQAATQAPPPGVRAPGPHSRVPLPRPNLSFFHFTQISRFFPESCDESDC